MIKFESYLANFNNKKNNTAITENKEIENNSIPKFLWLHSFDLKKGH